MAEDWVKMRTDLYRDPKVCVMADILLEPDGSLARYINQHCQRDMTVTRNVMRNVTVGALVSVWGVMRLRGKPVGDDLVCHGVTISVIDDIADLPGFGDAMEQVGWVLNGAEGLIFPRFFEDYNVDPEASSKQKAAERQRRFRERQKAESDGENNVTRNSESNVTGDVTVTSQSNYREEKRREEKKHVRATRFDAQAHLVSLGVETQIAKDWLATRKRKKLESTLTAMEQTQAEVAKAGVSLNDALRECCARGWGGFKASWLDEQPSGRINGHSNDNPFA